MPMNDDQRKAALAALGDAFEAATKASHKMQAAMIIATYLRIAGYELVQVPALTNGDKP